jgi:uncharacterized protein
MATFFFSPNTSGQPGWWRYPVTILLVVTGIYGFGGLPFLAALSSKGVSMKEAQQMSPSELNGLFTNNEQLTYNLFAFVVGFIMLLIAFRILHQRPALSFFTSRGKFDPKRFLAGFVIWGAFLGTLFVIGYLQDPSAVKWNYQPQQFGMLVLICLFLVPIQTGFEELLCRGYVLQWVGRATTRGLIAILVNGLLFGGLHLFNPEVRELGWFAILFYVISGCFAAFLAVMDDGIELSWGYHTANNFMGLLIISSEWQALPTDSLFIDPSKPSIGIELILTLAVGYPLMILLLSKMYRWSQWKQRLLGKP